MQTDTVHYDQYRTQRKELVMEQKQPEWISTTEAAKILKVESTQAVRYLMEQYPDKLPGMNVGSEKQPRWVLRWIDVVNFQLDRTDEL